MEVFTVEAQDEISARVGDHDANVHAVHADTNVGSWMSGLLGKRSGGEHERV
jgi:hypothetical protein